jgi:DNA-binding GntR family transcriptional regulator
MSPEYAPAPDPKNAIADKLEMDIIFGRLAPAQRLIEDDLMARFGTSRHKVRGAIDMLTIRGMAVRETNKGAHVCSYTGAEILQIYELRNILQDAAIGKISFPVDPAIIATLRSIDAAHVAAASTDAFDEVFHLNNLFHQTVFSCCNNPALAEVVEVQARRTVPIRTNNFMRTGYLSLAQSEHKKMIDALEHGNAEALTLLTRTHMMRPMRDYLSQYNLAQRN